MLIYTTKGQTDQKYAVKSSKFAVKYAVKSSKQVFTHIMIKLLEYKWQKVEFITQCVNERLKLFFIVYHMFFWTVKRRHIKMHFSLKV